MFTSFFGFFRRNFLAKCQTCQEMLVFLLASAAVWHIQRIPSAPSIQTFSVSQSVRWQLIHCSVVVSWWTENLRATPPGQSSYCCMMCGFLFYFSKWNKNSWHSKSLSENMSNVDSFFRETVSFTWSSSWQMSSWGCMRLTCMNVNQNDGFMLLIIQFKGRRAPVVLF